MSASIQPIVFIGLDVSSRDCWAAIVGQRPRPFELSPAGAAALLSWVRRFFPTAPLRAVLEHTGVYSLAWAALLRPLDIECALCNAGRIRHFALSKGQRSKTDKADAKAILAYALQEEPAASLPRNTAQMQLDLLVKTRDGAIKQRVALQNQLSALSFIPECLALVEAQIQLQVDALRQAEANLEAQIKALLAADEILQRADQVLQSIKGIGSVCSSQVCVILDKALDCNCKQFTALAGLAPSHRESGISVHGRSHIDKAGRPQLRKCFYMAAVSASRHDPYYAAFKARLEAKGKAGKVIIVAIARQLLLTAQKALKRDETLLQLLSTC